jgi:hypothetical protein
LVFFAAFLAFFAAFFVAMVSILPFHFHGIIATFISSQFVSCIDLIKTIVKKKTHVEMRSTIVRERKFRLSVYEKLCIPIPRRRS